VGHPDRHPAPRCLTWKDDDTMTTAIIAITTAIAALSGVALQYLITLTTERRSRTDRERQELRTAILNVLATYVRFRQQQYKKIDAYKAGTDQIELRDQRWNTRTKLTDAIDALYLTTSDQALLDAAETARRLVVELGDAAAPGNVDDARVNEIGQRARQAHTALRIAARHALHH
jgi:predicted aconitase